MSQEMKEYRYKGPVLKYGACVINNFDEITIAPNKSKAMSNFKYRAKKKLGLLPNVGGIELPGKIEEV